MAKSMKSRFGFGKYARDAQHRGDPIHVSGDAQTKILDAHFGRQFISSQPPQYGLPERSNKLRSSTLDGYESRGSDATTEVGDHLQLPRLSDQGNVTTFFEYPQTALIPTPEETPESESEAETIPRTAPEIATTSSHLPRRTSSRRGPHPHMEALERNGHLAHDHIGMALGSPTHQPPMWQSNINAMDTISRSSSPDDTVYIPSRPSERKNSRWKSLGGLFGGSKKHTGQARSFYQLQPEPSMQQRVDPYRKPALPDHLTLGGPPLPETRESRSLKSRGRVRTESQWEPEMHQLKSRRANTEPLDFQFHTSTNAGWQAPNPQNLSDEGSIKRRQPSKPHNPLNGGLIDQGQAPKSQDLPDRGSINREQAPNPQNYHDGVPTNRGRAPKPQNLPNGGLIHRGEAPKPQIFPDGGQIHESSLHSSQKEMNRGGTMVDDAIAEIKQKDLSFLALPRLEVEIPSVRMERYSVMFSSVLNRSSTTSSSLLARRQATNETLQTFNEDLVAEERESEANSTSLLQSRQTTSPQLTKSPGFSLFPNAPARLTVGDNSTSTLFPQSRSPRQRSNTSPASLSPYGQTFARASDYESPGTVLRPPPAKSHQAHYHSPSMHNTMGRNVDPDLIHNQQQNPQNWLAGQSHRNPNSHSTGTDEEDESDSAPLPMKERFNEPQWQMVPPYTNTTPSVSGSATSGSEHSKSTSESSISGYSSSSSYKTSYRKSPPSATRTRSRSASSAVPHPSRIPITPARQPNYLISYQPILKDEEVDELEKRLETAAEMSIARQISISRSQSHLLASSNQASTLSVKNKSSQSFSAPLKAASPLAAVAAGKSPVAELGRKISPNAEKKTRNTESMRAKKLLVKSGANERLVDGVKPSTPTLVIVPGGVAGNETHWDGATISSTIPSAEISSSRPKTRNASTGEIKVGMTVGPRRKTTELQHRKSERAVVERA